MPALGILSHNAGRSPVNDIQFGAHAGLPSNSAEATRTTQDITLHPTPREVLAKIAGVIAICLGLALLAHLLITAPPG
jgi:hypothetical protein